MTKKIDTPPLGDHVISGIDVSPVMGNYYVKYGGEPIREQLDFFQALGISHLFDRRVMMGAVFGNSILDVHNFDFSGYSNGSNNCNGYDGVMTRMRELPIMIGCSDCPEILVAGETAVGIVHSTSKTLDQYILDHFFEMFFETEDPDKTKVAFSPYILPMDYFGNFEDLDRFNEWVKEGCVQSNNGQHHLDLGKMNRLDLLRLGLSRENIYDAQHNSYRMSRHSHKDGGYAISHRHAANTPGSREGRGIVCIMLK